MNSPRAPRVTPRADWTPRNRAELCACVAWMFCTGQLTPADWEHVTDYVAFRARRLPTEKPHTTPAT